MPCLLSNVRTVNCVPASSRALTDADVARKESSRRSFIFVVSRKRMLVLIWIFVVLFFACLDETEKLFCEIKELPTNLFGKSSQLVVALAVYRWKQYFIVSSLTMQLVLGRGRPRSGQPNRLGVVLSS